LHRDSSSPPLVPTEFASALIVRRMVKSGRHSAPRRNSRVLWGVLLPAGPWVPRVNGPFEKPTAPLVAAVQYSLYLPLKTAT
jgi:hypothetical protein